MNIRLSAPFRLILAALLVLSLQACATRGTEIGTSAPSDASNAAWQAYQGYASARASDHDPYRLSGSLRYGSQGDTRRVETLLWSNGYLPIRLDVMAGIGALVARIQETQDSFTAYAPNENKAIVHKGPQRVQLNFGRPVPFSLRDFSSLMRGRFHEVFGAAEGLNPRATRQHNNANVLCLGERVTGQGVALDIAELFLNTAFEGGRHLRRINQIEG